jgi:ABC-2 type transport system permease protein
MNLIKSEFRKLLYIKTFWGLLVGSIFLAVLSTAPGPYAITRVAKDIGLSPLTSADTVDGLYSKSLAGYIFVLTMGVIVSAGEFRHHTAVATFLTAPKRASVVIAKLAVAAVAGVVYMIVSAAAGMASTKIALGFYKDAAEPHSSVFVSTFVAAVVTGAVMAILGVAVGTLIRNQQIAVTGSILWLFLVERLITVFWTEIGKFLPSGLITSMMSLHISTSDNSSGFQLNTADYLEPVPATFLLLAYGVVFAAVAMFTTLRRDVD